MFRTKICGITTVEDALVCVEAGADAIGLNFYPKSKRYISPEQATAVADAVRGSLMVAGVFVNETVPRIEETASLLSLDVVQLHGDEPPSLVAQLSGRPILRARRLDEHGLPAVADDLAACRVAGRTPDALLLDSAAAGHYGGTGETLAWPALQGYQKLLGQTPLVLAGGLTADNVAQAIAVVGPAGVDVASGVEQRAGLKDAEKVRQFVAAAHAALG